MNKSEFNDFSFLQLENEELRRRLKAVKENVGKARENINYVFRELECTFLSKTDDGSVILNKEDQMKILNYIDHIV